MTIVQLVYNSHVAYFSFFFTTIRPHSPSFPYVSNFLRFFFSQMVRSAYISRTIFLLFNPSIQIKKKKKKEKRKK
jgi:hypothetical protein